MIDRTQDLPVTRQCQILKLARSTAYYTPQPTSDSDLQLMRRIDELHLEFPFAGSQMLRDMLRREGQQIGRKHVRTVMKKMGSRRSTASRTRASAMPTTRSIPIC
jgi:putative transposase